MCPILNPTPLRFEDYSTQSPIPLRCASGTVVPNPTPLRFGDCSTQSLIPNPQSPIPNLQSPISITAGAASTRGLVRANNQDAYALPLAPDSAAFGPRAFPYPVTPDQMAAKGTLFLVADGVGGRDKGEQASQSAVCTVPIHYYADPSDDFPGSLRRAVEAANQEIRREGAQMATTLVALIIRGDQAIIANVGDSRAYRLRGNRLRLLSQDHSWVAEQVRQGHLTVGEAAASDLRHRISRSVGGADSAEVDLFQEAVQPGDRFLLCTDGVSGYLDGGEIARQMFRRQSPQATAETLVALAEAAGGRDNATALVVDVDPLVRARTWGRLGRAAAWTAIALLLVLLGLWIGSQLAYRFWGDDLVPLTTFLQSAMMRVLIRG